MEKSRTFVERRLFETLQQTPAPTPAPWTMFLSFPNVVDFVKGTLSGANIAKTGPMVTCIDNANAIINGGQDVFNKFVANFTIYGGLLAVDNMLNVIYKAGGLSADCVNGVLDAS